MRKKPIFYLKLSVVFCFAILLATYFFYQSRDYFFGPRILLDYPLNGQSINNAHLFLKGKILNASSLSVDGRSVLVDTLGNFETDLILAEGYNIIHLSTKDKFDRVVNKKLEVVLK